MESLFTAIGILVGPLALWIALRLHPEWFNGQLVMVKWIIAILIGVMVMVSSFSIYRQRSAPPPVIEFRPPSGYSHPNK